VGAEAVTHSYYDVPTEEFGVFFEVLVDTLRALLGVEWTDAFETAWARLLYELDLYVKNGSQPTERVAARL
jgi:hemoglobin-like flavoprotein